MKEDSFRILSSKYPAVNEPMILNNPTSARAQPPVVLLNPISMIYVGRCVAINATCNPHTKKPVVSNK